MPRYAPRPHLVQSHSAPAANTHRGEEVGSAETCSVNDDVRVVEYAIVGHDSLVAKALQPRWSPTTSPLAIAGGNHSRTTPACTPGASDGVSCRRSDWIGNLPMEVVAGDRAENA